MLEMIVGILNKILEMLRDLILMVINLLPDSPFVGVTGDEILVQLFRRVNYFLPVQEVLTFMPIWLSAVLVWYGVRWLLRIAKYID